MKLEFKSQETLRGRSKKCRNLEIIRQEIEAREISEGVKTNVNL